MRQIEFRAIEVKTNKWVYFTLQELVDTEYDFPELKNWCEFTGLFDKDRVAIYEGDIVKGQMCYAEDDGSATKPENAIGEVRFGEFMGSTGFWITRGMNFTEFPIEVIGTIYENKELLK